MSSRARRKEEASILCPFCFERLILPVDRSAGSEQSFVYDCEVCCRASVVSISIDDSGDVTASAERES